ncbi:hypothetical protein CAPTEDRAFT_94348 [Capitella teleta]|uniref:AAA+ ATPase domain-containing protein n=1 Tax=Capitella teleta TaxID=283909 RepID=R7U457_CAPTE|nr:hypothetical protein CAPTEDRAFT_94348 [Capitella teleta]|eukprot:ELU01135.1 hypothetical protein CAPTEDRAFT_94348 [Capitella teleta]
MFILIGVGKTTLLCKTCEVLQKKGFTVQGFYTEEVRLNGKRIGFDIVTVPHNARSALARVGNKDVNSREPCVGQYVVQLQSFESLALSALRSTVNVRSILVIDEIGKMELFSSRFVSQVRKILNSEGSSVICTIPVPKGRPIPLVEEIRNRANATVFTVTRDNRDSLLDEVVNCAVSSIS